MKWTGIELTTKNQAHTIHKHPKALFGFFLSTEKEGGKVAHPRGVEPVAFGFEVQRTP